MTLFSANLESMLLTLLVQVTVVLALALPAHQLARRSAAARHAILLAALLTIGGSALWIIALRVLHVAPPISLPQIVPPLPASASNRLAISLVSSDHVQPVVQVSLVDALLALWFAGSFLAILRLLRGLYFTWQIRRAAVPLAVEKLKSLLQPLAAHLGRNPPPIYTSERIQIPLAVGSLRPAVLLPSSLPDNLNRQQLLQVLIHESAHAIRRDPLVGLYQRVLAAALWFHPLVYLANRWLDQAREELCDNRVLHAFTAADYSRTLLCIAESFESVDGGLLVQPIFRSDRRLDRRVADLLNPGRCTMVRWNAWKIATLAVIFAAASLLACSGATEINRDTGYDLSHVVHFEIGRTQFADGDKITIEEIRGTSDKISAGNTYVIKGTYHLASEKSAMLAAFTTGNGSNPQHVQMQNIPNQRTQTMMVDQGDGKFSLILYMWYDGHPHISFYSNGNGNATGGVYFGTGDSLYK